MLEVKILETKLSKIIIIGIPKLGGNPCRMSLSIHVGSHVVIDRLPSLVKLGIPILTQIYFLDFKCLWQWRMKHET